MLSKTNCIHEPVSVFLLGVLHIILCDLYFARTLFSLDEV
jgi:hypothetical protein